MRGRRGRLIGRAAVNVVVALLVGFAAPAAAQVPDTAGPLPGDTVRIPELVVRALRTPAAADALPYAVTVRRPDLGVPSAGLSLGSELRAVPGLQVQGRYNDAMGDRIVVRGFGARAQFGVRGVQVLVDGIPATMPDGQTTLSHLDLSVLERAEVVRGPAAAAYGNAAGGVLLLTTESPPAERFRQEVEGVAGGGGLLRLRSTSGGTGSATGWVASVTREARDGFRPHSGTERYQLTGRLDAPLWGGYLRAVGHGVSYDADNPGSLTLEQFQEEPAQAQAYNVAQRTGEEGLHGQLGVAWERPTPAGRLEVVAYGLTRTLDNPIPPTIIDLDRRAGGARVLLRSDRAEPTSVAWAVGVDGAVQGDDRQNYENEDGTRGALTLDQSERVTNVAVHGSALLPLLDRLGLFLGARYDRIFFSAKDRLISAGNPDDSGDRAMDAVSPTAGLRLDVAPWASLFGNVSTAFESPTTTELVNRPDGSGGFNPSLDPQRTVSYEVGGRARLASTLHVQASAYHARVTDALVPFEVESAPGRQYFRNAGGATHRGFELLAELRSRRLDALAAYGRTDATFTDYVTDEGSFEGNELPGVRPWTVGLVLAGRPAGLVTLEGSYEATGEMAVDDANQASAPGYELLGVRASVPGLRTGRWSVRPYAGVDNLLDEAYVASVVPNAFGARFYEPGPGRTFYLGVELAVAVARSGP